MSLRLRTPNLFTASNLWTPANSSVQPLLLMMDANAVWSGSSLASIINAGSEGGSFSIRGGPDKGTAINGLDPIRFDNNGEALYKTLDFPNTGKLSFFHYGRLISAAAPCGVINRQWDDVASNRVVYYNNCAAAGFNSFLIANRAGASTDSAPAWEATIQFQTAGSINSVYGQGGATNDGWRDGVQNALTGTNLSGSFPLAGAVPDYPSYDWEFGRGRPQSFGGGETSNTEFLCIALFSDWLSSSERQKWEGYWHWRGGTQAQLPVGHPYLSAAPTMDAETFATYAAFSTPQDAGRRVIKIIGY